MIKKDYFCSFPFNTFFLGSDGGVKFCCSSRLNLGNINETPISEILQNDLSKEVRKSIISNEWHMPHCSQCFELEQNGGRSERTSSVEHNYDTMKFIDDIEYFKLEKLDIRWSNTCNLACNYCYEYFSSKWAKILNIHVPNNREKSEELVFEFIEQNKDTISNINLLGGEPLLQKQNERLIKTLPNSRYYVLTNLSVPLETNRIMKTLLELKPDNLEIGVSFETIGDKFEYVRHGAKWDSFIENIKFMKDRGYKLNAHPLFCIYSALNLVEFYDFIDSTDCFEGVYWCLLINIQALDVFEQSKKLKHEVIQEIDRCINKYASSKKYDFAPLIEIRNRLYKQTNEITNNITSNKEEIVMKELKAFADRLETKYLLDKKHTMAELWPNIIEHKDGL